MKERLLTKIMSDVEMEREHVVHDQETNGFHTY